MGRDTPSFKQNVRKLKERGLTESLDIGYRLSARGAAILDHEGHPRSAQDRAALEPGTPLPHIGAPRDTCAYRVRRRPARTGGQAQ
nr:hypothetical protein GCM10020092_094530 [Actinoplanes digitatis]